jgi:hypothetical protein
LRDSASASAAVEPHKVHLIERALQTFIREQPWRSALIGASFVAAIGAGVVLGRLWITRDQLQWLRRLH